MTNSEITGYNKSCTNLELMRKGEIMGIDNPENPDIAKEGINYPKSNFLIGATYKSTLLENKIMAVSLARIAKAPVDKDGIIHSKMKAAELKKILKKKNGSFYNQLQDVAESMTGKKIGMTDQENQTFDFIAVIIRAHYENGIFTIEYNPRLRNYLQGLKRNFTMLNEDIMVSFNSNYAFRIYELLRCKVYKPNKEPLRYGDTFQVEYDLAELKLLLGIVNSELESVQKVLKKSKFDYEKAVNVCPEKVFSEWNELKRRVLNVAVKEINEKTDITIEYYTVKSGVGAKVCRVGFNITYRGKEDLKKSLTEEEKDEFLDSMYSLIKEPLRLKDMKAIAEAAEYDIEKVKKAYNVLEKTTAPVNNVVGFLLKAIENDYSDPVEKKGTSREGGASQFNQFMQTEYDFDELEKDILAN